MTENEDSKSGGSEKPNRANGSASWAYRIAAVLTILAAATLVVGFFFLPYVSTTGDTREYYEEYPDAGRVDGLNMSNGDAVDVTLLEYARGYHYLIDRDGDGTIDTGWAFYFGLFVACGVIFALTLLLAVLRKPIGSVIFAAMSYGMLYLIGWDLEERGIVDGDMVWGYAHDLLPIAAIVVAVGSIVMLVAKVACKAARKQAQGTNGQVGEPQA